MEIIGTVLTIILVFIILILFMLASGIITRLIFKKTDEIKLRNWTALIPAIASFIAQFRHGNITEMIDSFSEGLEFSHWAISTALCLFYFGLIYVIQRWFVYWGIGIVDIIRKKSQPVA